MADYDIKRLKSVGLMKQKEKDLFSLRLRVVGGRVTSLQLAGLAETARKYGKSYLHLTTRQGIEIPNVEFKDIEKLKGELAKIGLETGAGGSKLRTVTACQGAECSHGLIDCFALAQEIEREYFGIDGYPHKFKIGITGCINGCIKPQENDLGIMGRFHNGHKGYVIFVGGKMGRSPKFGVKAFDFIETKERLLGIIKKTLEFYRKFGIEGERFGDTLERVGIEKYKEEALKG